MLDMAEYDQQVELTIRLSRKSVDENQMRQTASDLIANLPRLLRAGEHIVVIEYLRPFDRVLHHHLLLLPVLPRTMILG